MEQHSKESSKLPAPSAPRLSGTARKRIRVIKKVRIAPGVWKFISLDHVGNRYVWDKREGYYFLEWWQGKKRRRERAGLTPNEGSTRGMDRRSPIEVFTLSSYGFPPGRKDVRS